MPTRLFFWPVLLLLFWVISLVSRNPSSSQGKLFLSLVFLVDSVRQSFLLIEEKKQKFLSLLRHVLHSDATDVKTLQRLSDKCISFSLAIPGTRLFLNEVYNAIGKGLRYGSSKLIPISRPLREELQQWLFLESWSGCLP